MLYKYRGLHKKCSLLPNRIMGGSADFYIIRGSRLPSRACISANLPGSPGNSIMWGTNALQYYAYLLDSSRLAGQGRVIQINLCLCLPGTDCTAHI